MTLSREREDAVRAATESVVPRAGRHTFVRAGVATLVLMATSSRPSLGAPAPRRAPSHAPKPAPRPVGSLASLAVAEVDITLRRSAALVTADLTFTRGTYRGGDVEVFWAYGAPGVPRAFDAHLVPVEEGFFLPVGPELGAPLTTGDATHAPPEASLVIGPPTHAGQVIRLRESELRASLATSGLAALRVRSVHALGESAAGASLLVRLSSPQGPLPLGVVSVRGEGVTIGAASASLCDKGREPRPLVVAGFAPPEGAVAPPLARRSAADELCVDASFDP